MGWPREMNVQKLKCNPVVAHVNQRGLEFTPAFKIELFKMWKLDPTPERIQAELKKVDILEEDIFSRATREISNSFHMNGYPFCRDRSDSTNDPCYAETNPLVLSGKFYRTRKGRGLIIDPDFRQELKKTYPGISIEEKMKYLGIDPLDVGYNRINRLRHEFDEEMSSDYLSSESRKGKVDSTSVTASGLVDHPYVRTVEQGNLYMTESFFNETYMLPLPLSGVLEIYGIDGAQVSDVSKMRIFSALSGWSPVKTGDFSSDEEVLKIQNRRASAMHLSVKKNFCELGQVFDRMKLDDQRKVCRWIDALPRDPWNFYTRKKILALMDLSKSRYYALLNDENYGMGRIRKDQQDEEDILVIRKVLDYKGFEKGIRQVYMLMPRVTGRSFSMYRIRRLMNKYGIRTTIRRPSRNRKAMKELIERNRKANLIMRRFRLHRPNEVRLTDVTYLDYGKGERAYGSASVDPVTGRLICFIVSENNDLQLALDTLEAMDRYPAKSGAIFHSDQGIVYMTDDFQAAVVERELLQSMSRRGNCWDNAVQESFFGHFKDECHYERCETLEELQKCIDNYGDYYNNERGMWDRGRMTPAEYEKYLEDMDETAFSEYLIVEERRYEDMKKRAAENARRTAKDYREFTERSIGGTENEVGGQFKEV